MKQYLCILFAVASISLFGSWDWAFSLGGDSMERLWDISCDASSNIYVAGDFSDSLCVNGQTYHGYGLADSFVLKYNPAGELQWAQSFGSPAEDVALSIAADAEGNSYITGYFVDTITIQNQSVTSNGAWDVYVLKLDPLGNLIWLNSFGGTMSDIGYGLALSSSGKVFVAGWFSGSVSFPDGSSMVSAGGSDIFCYALDTQGNFIWSQRAGTAGVEYAYEVSADDEGNAYVTGVAGVGTQFGNYSLTGSGMFVCKYSPTGAVQWLASGEGGAVVDIAVQPQVNPSQYGMVCGRLNGSGAFGSFPFSSIGGGDDAYWAKFDANTGTWLSLNAYGGSAADKGKDVDCEEFPAFVASFEETAAFGAVNYLSIGESDIALGYGNNAMQFTTAGGESSEIPTGIKILPNGMIAICGWHFGLGQIGSFSIDSGNVADQNAFIACYSPQSSVNDEHIMPVSNMKCSPNPFTSDLRISVSKATITPSPIEVYNLKGQIVHILHPESESTTELQYRWNGQDTSGKNCSAGVYLLKNSSGTIKTLKLK